MALRVVSLPATASSRHEQLELRLGEPVAVDLGVDQLGDDVVAWVGPPRLAEPGGVDVQLGRGGAGLVAWSSLWYSGSSAPTMRFDQSKSR